MTEPSGNANRESKQIFNADMKAEMESLLDDWISPLDVQWIMSEKALSLKLSPELLAECNKAVKNFLLFNFLQRKLVQIRARANRILEKQAASASKEELVELLSDEDNFPELQKSWKLTAMLLEADPYKNKGIDADEIIRDEDVIRAGVYNEMQDVEVEEEQEAAEAAAGNNQFDDVEEEEEKEEEMQVDPPEAAANAQPAAARAPVANQFDDASSSSGETVPDWNPYMDIAEVGEWSDDEPTQRAAV